MGSVSRLLKNTTLLMASNFATKGLSALFIIYLARYLGDRGFGQYNFALSFAAVFIIFSDLGLDALTIKNVARDRASAGEYLESVGMFRVGFSLVMIALSLALCMFMGFDRYMLMVILAAGLIYLFDKLSGLFYAIFRANERMELEAGTQISWKAIQLALGLIAIYFGFTLLNIMLLLLVSSVIKTIISFTLLARNGIRPTRGRLSQKSMLRDTAPFAAYEIGNAIYMNMAIILLFLMQTPEDTGWFSAGLRVIMFMLLIPSAFDAAIFPVFSRLFQTSEWDMRYALGKSLKLSLLLAVPVAVLLAILSDSAASIFGSGFGNTGNAVLIMAALLPLYTLNMLMKSALWSGDAQKRIAINIWVSVAIITACSYLLIREYAYAGAALALVISDAAFLALNYRDARQLRYPVGRYLAKPILAGACMALSALGMHIILGHGIGRFHMAFLATLVYILAILLMGTITRTDRDILRAALSSHRP